MVIMMNIIRGKNKYKDNDEYNSKAKISMMDIIQKQISV